jgi:hypothetical protein
MLAFILIVASLWVEGLAPLYQRLGIARSVQIPICACLGLNSPGYESPDEVVDLDPSIDDYNKFRLVSQETRSSELLVRYPLESNFIVLKPEAQTCAQQQTLGHHVFTVISC